MTRTEREAYNIRHKTIKRKSRDKMNKNKRAQYNEKQRNELREKKGAMNRNTLKAYLLKENKRVKKCQEKRRQKQSNRMKYLENNIDQNLNENRSLRELYRTEIEEEDKDLPMYLKRSVQDQLEKNEVIRDYLKENAEFQPDQLRYSLRASTKRLHHEEDNVSITSSQADEKDKYIDIREEQARKKRETNNGNNTQGYRKPPCNVKANKKRIQTQTPRSTEPPKLPNGGQSRGLNPRGFITWGEGRMKSIRQQAESNKEHDKKREKEVRQLKLELEASRLTSLKLGKANIELYATYQKQEEVIQKQEQELAEVKRTRKAVETEIASQQICSKSQYGPVQTPQPAKHAIQIDYEQQRDYWTSKSPCIETMAHTEEASKVDLIKLQGQLQRMGLAKYGGRVLDLCGGIGRCGPLLSKHFDTIDILDIDPGWGKIKKKNRGDLIIGSLQNLKQLIGGKQYNAVFGNWALCYINDDDVHEVLAIIQSILLPGGVIILKEPIRSSNQQLTELCESGQGMLYRHPLLLNHWLSQHFDLEYTKGQVQDSYGQQMVCYGKVPERQKT